MFTAAFIGEQTLLIQCAQYWLEQGHAIEHIVAKNPIVVSWCEERDIQVTGLGELANTDSTIDYLFSITNLRILPEKLLQLPQSMAINFHDGPLPRYAGLNVPAWAILHGEQSHGVTFHEMTSEVDQGNILKQKLFPIVSDETAFTLNAKCYQAANEAFDELTDELTKGTLQSQPQQAFQEHYFGLGKKPDQSAILDFSNSDKSLSQLTRAMDYGVYDCPLSYPKLFLGNGNWVSARHLSMENSTADSLAGTVLDISTQGLLIACDQGAVRLSGFYSITGESLCPLKLAKEYALSLDCSLPKAEEAQTHKLNAVDLQIGRHEAYWIKQLQQNESISIPYATHQTSDNEQKHILTTQALPDVYHTLLTEFGVASDVLVSALSAYFSRIGGKHLFNLAFTPRCLAELIDGVENFYANALPLSISLSTSQCFEEFHTQQIKQLEHINKRQTFSRDLYLRTTTLHQQTHCEQLPLAIERVPTNNSQEPNSYLKNDLILQIPDDGKSIVWSYLPEVFHAEDIEKMQEQFFSLLASIKTEKQTAISQLNILSEKDRKNILGNWNATDRAYDQSLCIHSLFEQKVLESPDSIALIFEGQSLSYTQLNNRSNQLARHIQKSTAGEGQFVGVLVDRSVEMIISLLAVLKAGYTYVPLDPVYPQDRLTYMVSDSQAVVVICNDHNETLLPTDSVPLIKLEQDAEAIARCDSGDLPQNTQAEGLAYLIYTSGSTGKPKGVMVTHRNVINFFTGMDEHIDGEQGTWLAVTSISFDISVLEIFWTLARGFKVVLYADDKRQKTAQTNAQSQHPDQHIDFSLFYWNVAGVESENDTDKYRLLLEGAKFGDKNGFKAVWNPERHFASFGGLFPNPSITCAALATITEKIELRAGSCVIPLHSPIRVAEEWSVIDNLSNGRVGIAVASGWAPPDFAIKPENYERAKEIMFESLETVQKLWRGETVQFPGPNGEVAVRTLPRPIQKTLPAWVTTAGNLDTFKQAAKNGHNILTHLLGQSAEEVAEKVKAYREEWKAAGHAGEGIVTLMLHTFVGPDQETVKECVRGPLKEYLKSAMFLVKGAAWNFPTFKKMSDDTGKTLDEFFDTISDEDMDDLLEFAFQRYFHSSGLFGTPESCLEMVDQCKSIGVDEIGCLIDFGIQTDLVIEHLPYLAQLLKRGIKQESSPSDQQDDQSIPALMKHHKVSHLQCTPSMAMMLAADSVAREPLANLQQMMVGGEAFPTDLATDLHKLVSGKVTNMYGPTEATVWSCIQPLDGKAVSIGRPIANTQIYIVDENMQLLPVGIPGELLIAGDGVVPGYYRRDELNVGRFIVNPFSTQTDAKLYRTGDLAKFENDGRITYLGRIDHQVKIRGYRVELGEIEALLSAHPSITEAVVLLREDVPGDKRLVAYIKMQANETPDTRILKTWLLAHLPDFMVPGIYIELKTLPLTPNGKTDRKALPAPKSEHRSTAGAVIAPSNEWEELLAEIWKRAIDIPEVSTRDNFFDIGGHSLLVIQVLKELRDNEKIHKKIQMTDLFRHTTIESLAKFIDSEDDDTTVIDASQARAATRKAAMGRRRRKR